ncbi:MAG: hypothetical protein ACRCZW_09525, partial [Lactobacillaceae bacterium]
MIRMPLNYKNAGHAKNKQNKLFKTTPFIRSLLEQQLRYGHLTRGYANLNSNRTKELVNERVNKEMVKFEIPIPGQSNKFIVEIEQIKDISQVDILE